MSGEPQVQHLCDYISCHCWNHDGTRIAYSPCSKEIIVAKYENGKFTTESVLKQHDARVTSIDWCLCEGGQIVSCSEDRNAYVWTETEPGKWEPVLVMLRIEYSANDVKWAPNGQKFACASGSKIVAICTFNEESNWWASEHSKHFKSSVTKLAWSPDSMTVAATGTDRTVKLVNAFNKKTDPKESFSPFFGEKLSSPKNKLGTILYETEKLKEELWYNAVTFTPNGQTIIFATQTGKIGFIEANGGSPTVQMLETDKLPFVDLLCLDDNRVVAVGHHFNPCLFVREGTEWKFKEELDKPKEQKKSAMNAREIFTSMTNKGTTEFKNAAEQIPTRHKNVVTCIRAKKYDENWNVLEFSTSAMDGNVIVWKA